MSRIHAFSMTALAGAVLLASGQSLAGGLSLNEQSASGLGTAYAGRGSSALDASTVYGNPAGMSRLDRAQISGGAVVLFPNISIKNATGEAPGTNDGDMVPTSTIPFGYYVTPISDRWHFGLGVYAPFGGHTDYEDSFQGRYQGLETEVRVITVQPTISYQIHDWLSAGVGVTVNRIDGTLRNNLLTTPFGGTEDALLRSTGDDYGYGYNLGIMAEFVEGTTFGLTYYSKVEYTLEGHTTLSGMPAAAGPATGLVDGRYDSTLDFTTPEHIGASISHELNDRWTVHGGAVWTRWSRVESIIIDNSGAPPGGALEQLEEDVRFRDTLGVSLGASYQLNPQWLLRAGVALDEAPTSNEDRTVRAPYGYRKVVSLGAGWSPTPDFTVDVGYAYLWENDAPVEQDNPTGLRPAYSATFDTDVHGLGAQLTYRF